MKDLYYLIVREGHGDTEPCIAGPFKTSQAARKFAEEEYEATLIFTVIEMGESGYADYVASFSGEVSPYQWVY